jgi:hypothetical protein
MQSNLDKALQLLDQVIEKNLYDDYKKNKGEKPGQSWDVYHLNLLKELLIKVKNNE